MTISAGKTVRMEYELAIDGGELIESSHQRGPIEYVQGEGAMLAGLESELEGLTVGDEKSGVIPPESAYGTVESLPTKTIAQSEFSGVVPGIGQQFEANQQDGSAVQFTVIENKGESVVVRFHHPLAGKAIRYKVKILEIR